MKINGSITLAESIIRQSYSNCCDSTERLEVIICCDSTDKECSVYAVCPSCRTRYIVEVGERSMDSNKQVLCDAKTHLCKVA